MAIVAVQEKKDRRSGNWQRNWKRYYKRVFQVITDDQHDDAVLVLYAKDPNTLLQIPSLGVLYRAQNGNFDGGSYCDDVSAECDAEDGKQWTVTCSYSPYDPTQFDAQNPLEAPPKVRFGLSRQSIAADRDINGKPVTNSAGQSFDPPIEKDDSRLTMSVEVNVATFDANMFSKYKDTVNDAEWWIFAQKTVKFMNASAELQHSGDCPINSGLYWVMTWEFEIKEDTWTKKILDQGLMQLKADDPTMLQPCVDSDGNPVSEPVLLDGSGGQLSSGGNAVYLNYDVYDTMDFSVFNLQQRGPY